MIKFEISLRKIFSQTKLNMLNDIQLDSLARIIQMELIKIVPVRTGQLLTGIRWRRQGRDRIIYIHGKRNNEVASYLVFGTKPHVIYPKRKKALAWIDYNTMSLVIRKKSKPKGIKAGKYFKWEVPAVALVTVRNLINKFVLLYHGELLKLNIKNKKVNEIKN